MNAVSDRWDAQALAEKLAQCAEDVARHLLPDGKRAGSQWRVGSADGEAGQSMVVHLRGPRQGRWHDFATGEDGDLLDLFARRQGRSVAEGMQAAIGFLGLSPGSSRPRPMTPRSFSRPQKGQAHALHPAAIEWLRARGFTDATIKAFRIGSSASGDAIVLPYLRDGELVNVKTRYLAEKRHMQTKGAEPCLFGWHLIAPDVRAICIAEGEWDAMALHQVGIPALSVNAGAGNHQWLDNDWERLDRFSTIYLCFDDDEAGRKGVAEVANRLGVERCRIVTFPKKDANDYLLAGGTPEQFRAALGQAKAMDPPELVPLVDFFEQVMAKLFPAENSPDLDPPLYLPEQHEWIRFRPGEVTVWTGKSGHGKTLMLSQVSLGFMREGQRVLVFSGEMPPADQLRRTLLQAAGLAQPAMGFARAIRDWLADRIWVYNVVGTTDSARLLEVFAYGARRYGIAHFIVDSLMMFDDVGEDTRGALELQRKLMLRLKAFAMQFGAHVHLVAHPRKSTFSDDREPGKDDVAGSSKITSIADNVLSVWANQKPVDDRDDPSEPDGAITLRKQRNGPVQIKRLPIWFDQPSGQYRARSIARPVSYVDYDVREHSKEDPPWE